MKVFFICFLVCVFAPFKLNAQYAAQENASYLAIVKVVADYKINDEEEIREMQSLRENENFNKKLEKMLGELTNSEVKNTKNQKVLKILLQAGKDIERALNVGY